MSNINMKKWLEGSISSQKKKAMPILSFPCISLLDIKVNELISDSEMQAKGMCAVAGAVASAASVSLMDLSVEAECFGAQTRFSNDEVPTIVDRLINGEDDAQSLTVPEVGSARSGLYVEAMRLACERITDRPVLAGMIGPFSLGARLYDVSEIMMECYDDPDTVHLVLDKVTEFLINYALAYKSVGANGIVMAEPVAGMLSPSLEEEFSAPFVKRIVDAVQDDSFIVIYHNCGDIVAQMTESILSTGAAAYHFGNSVDMAEMIEKLPADVLVMGNVDPVSAFRAGTPESVREATLELLERCSKYPNFIISSGCDIPPATPWENIHAFFGAVEEYYGS
jgi:uroporphyrinogen decarboxylase